MGWACFRHSPAQLGGRLTVGVDGEFRVDLEEVVELACLDNLDECELQVLTSHVHVVEELPFYELALVEEYFSFPVVAPSFLEEVVCHLASDQLVVLHVDFGEDV